VDCREDPSYLLSAPGVPLATAAGPGHLLLTEQPRTCRLSGGSVVQRVSAWRLP